MAKANKKDVQPLTADHERLFGDICADARVGFTAALDLVLIHNERPVRGTQPRSTLNPLTVLLAVAAWERFVADVRALATGEWKGTGVGSSTGAYLGEGTSKEAALVLGPASGGTLPEAWTVRSFRGWRGASPTGAHQLHGADAEFAEAVDAAVRLRNSVAHRCIPQNLLRGPRMESDADSHTIQAGWARLILALLL